MVSMMDILSGASPLISDVRQTDAGPCVIETCESRMRGLFRVNGAFCFDHACLDHLPMIVERYLNAGTVDSTYMVRALQPAPVGAPLPGADGATEIIETDLDCCHVCGQPMTRTMETSMSLTLTCTPCAPTTVAYLAARLDGMIEIRHYDRTDDAESRN